MRHGHYLFLLGLVLFVTLLASAAHASGVQPSSSTPRASAITAVCASHVTDTDADNTQPGALITREATSRLQTFRPPHEKDALTAQGFTQPTSPASFSHSVARTCAIACTAAHVYALHPRPPTLSIRA